jgi:hypothetical protein
MNLLKKLDRFNNSMNIKKDQQIEVEITGIAFGGKGLVHVNGMAVF